MRFARVRAVGMKPVMNRRPACRFSHTEVLESSKIICSCLGKVKGSSCALMTWLFIAHCSVLCFLRAQRLAFFFFPKNDDISPESESTERLTVVFWRQRKEEEEKKADKLEFDR